MERIEENKVQLKIEVESEKFAAAISNASKKVAKQVNIPGFRKGRVPKKVLENYLGKQALVDEALEGFVPGAYIEAVQEANIEPINQPQVEVVQAEEGKPLIFKATVEVKPEVKLGEYKGVEVEQESVEVSSEELDNYIEGLRQRHARLNTLEEGTVEKGDVAEIDFEGFIDGVAFEGGKGESHPLEIGSGTFIPGFEEQLIGAQVGEERDVNVTFPEEYQAENLAGKDAVFKVKVNGIKRKELPEVDDEFAKDVSEFETLEELKQDAEKRLQESAEKNAENKLKTDVVNKVVSNVDVAVPPVMVEQKLDTIFSNMEQRMQQQGISMDQYLQFAQTTKEKMREEQREEAAKGVKTDLTLEAISQKEGITATEEEVDKELEKMAAQYNQKLEDIKKVLTTQGNLDGLRYSIAMEKTIDFLVENAKVIEKEKTEEAGE